MRYYTRLLNPGGTYFFTAVTAERSRWLADANAVGCLLAAMRSVRRRHPFRTEALVVLPDHVHAIWRLPDNDTLFALRWELVKKYCAERLRQLGIRTPHPMWQPRFWEHSIRSDEDFAGHFDYVHYNPVKHGLAASPRDWRWSTFHRHVASGIYTPDWAAEPQRKTVGAE